MSKSTTSNATKRLKIAALIQSAKSVPCADCGESYPTYVMDFHHEGGKLFEMGTRSSIPKSLCKIKAEIEKCIVLCSNCHRERTHGPDFQCAIEANRIRIESYPHRHREFLVELNRRKNGVTA